MKAVISTTFDDKYLFFLPIVTWCWNKLGVEVICFLPDDECDPDKMYLQNDVMFREGMRFQKQIFDAPEHKQATYAQVSRLFAAGLVDLPDNEELITSDIDMAVLNRNFLKPPVTGYFDVYGHDLVPEGQLPMCYVLGSVKLWREYFTNGANPQACLDRELAHEEMENMRGNLWSRDQELLKKYIGFQYFGHERARPGTQFASLRYDRDDQYLLERLSPDTIDFHMPRPGFEDKNFEIILQVLQYHYPSESFEWLVAYKEAYSSLVNQTT